MSGVFVTGTGTEVGKTVVAATIARTAAAAGRRVAVFKPAVSGLDEGGEPDHALLRRAAGSQQSDDEIAPYRYRPPVSPHLGAALAGESIAPERLREAASRAAAASDELVVEGVGGFLVPLTLGYLVRDFARDLGLPVVIAAAPGLGTINHTLLTIESVGAVGLRRGGGRADAVARRAGRDRALQPRGDRAPRRGQGRDPDPPRAQRAFDLASTRVRRCRRITRRRPALIELSRWIPKAGCIVTPP